MSEGKNKRPHIYIWWLMQHGNTYYDDSKTDNTWAKIARAGNIYRQCEMLMWSIFFKCWYNLKVMETLTCVAYFVG